MSVLVDSDILIEVTRAKDAEVLRRWAQLSESQDAVLCSPVSIAELWQRALSREHDVLTNLFRTMNCVPVDAETGRKAGEFLRDYRKSHSLGARRRTHSGGSCNKQSGAVDPKPQKLPDGRP